jgi:hypothetical protein
MTAAVNHNEAPFPHVLQDLVDACEYRPGWVVALRDLDRGQGSRGLTLIITTDTVDTYHPDVPLRVNHLFPVPPAAYDWRSWRRWLFDQFVLVEQHEAQEFFVINGERPYAPSHGPGNDPYLIREIGTDLDRRTSFRGEVSPPADDLIAAGDVPLTYPSEGS